MIRKIFFSLLILFSCLFFIASCVPDEFKKEYNTDILWTPTINGPVAFGNLTLKDILEEMLDTAELDIPIEIDEDSTNLYYVIYSDHIKSIRADEWIEIDDQDFPEVYFYRSDTDIPADSLGNPGDTIPTQKIENFDFDFKHGEKIDSIFLKKGNLHTYTWSSIRHTGYLIIYSDQIRIGDEFYCDTVIISDPSGNFQDHTVKSLDGAALSLDNQTNPDTTFLEIKFDFYLIHAGTDIKAGEEVRVDMVFSDLEYKRAYGYFGDYDTVLIEDEQLEFEIFEGEFSGNVYFGDPRFNLNIENSFGLPISMDLYDLVGISKTGQLTNIVFEPGVNPFPIDAPSLLQEGQSVMTSISVNKVNSNIEEVTNTTLSNLTYNVRAISNPEGMKGRDNFIHDSSTASVDFEVVLPMDLRAEDFSLEDTVEFDLYDLLKVDTSYLSDDSTTLLIREVKSLEIRMETKNGMPVEINMQVYLVDSMFNIIDSLFTPQTRNVLPSGIDIDDDGKIDYPSENEIVLDFSSDRIDKIRDTKQTLVNGTFETTEEGQKLVKFYSYYDISFTLGVKAEANLRTIKTK